MSKKATKEELELLRESGYSNKPIEFYVNKVNMGVLENPDIVETCQDRVEM